jgi:hypothetical protein
LDVRWVSKESALLMFFSPGSGLSSHSVLQGQTTRQFSTTVKVELSKYVRFSGISTQRVRPPRKEKRI